jgi:D-3-phosphoglycerate dehydrogenase
MAAETIRDYVEHGTIRNSVNFPSCALPTMDSSAIRISVVNKNIPGMLSKITEAFARSGVNITQQINHSKGDIAYNVIDIDPKDSEKMNLKELQQEITMTTGVLSTRILFGTPGAGYARNVDGQYYV